MGALGEGRKEGERERGMEINIVNKNNWQNKLWLGDWLIQIIYYYRNCDKEKMVSYEIWGATLSRLADKKAC